MIPHDATIRDQVHALLVAANTLAANRVLREQIDELPDTDLPAIAVVIDSSAQNLSTAGGAPTFDVTGDLLVVGRVGHTNPADAVTSVDTIAGQMRDAILCAPAFLGLCQVRSWRLGRTFRIDARLIIGEARLVLSLSWRESVQTDPSIWPVFTGADMTTQGDSGIRVEINV